MPLDARPVDRRLGTVFGIVSDDERITARAAVSGKPSGAHLVALIAGRVVDTYPVPPHRTYAAMRAWRGTGARTCVVTLPDH